MAESNALDLEAGVFTWDDPGAIARSLKMSAETSTRRRTTPFRSAMSMLTFYINRAGAQLREDQLARLELAKDCGKLRRVVDVPVLLRRQTNARTVCTPAFVRTAECGRRCPGSGNQL